MNKILITALATSMVGTTSFATDSEWLELDREVAALNNAPILQDASGPHLSGWIIGAISSEDSGNSTGVADAPDNQGTRINAARINLSGSAGNGYNYKLGFDFTDTNELWRDAAGDEADIANPGAAGLTDAYIHFALGEDVNIKVGAFSNTTLKSANIDRNQTFFINRSYLGAMYSGRDTGFALDGNFDRINWELAIMNGHSGFGEDFAFSGHLDVDVMGTRNSHEGAFGTGEGTNLNVGVTFIADGSDTIASDDTAAGGDGTGSVIALGQTRDDTVILVDAHLTSGAFSAFGELANLDNDTVAFTGPTGDTSSPYSVGVGYAFGELYEIGFRYDDWDDALNTTRFVFGVNRYIQGHDMKWQLNFEGGESDIEPTTQRENDNSSVSLGFAVGF